MRYPDGRPSQYFYWDDIPARRLRPETLDREAIAARLSYLARSTLPQPHDFRDPPSTSALRSLPGFRPMASRSAHLTRATMTEETDKTTATPAAEETMPSEETTSHFNVGDGPSTKRELVQ